MAYLLECQELTKNYGRIQAIHGLSLALEAGETIGLVGPNGAGKSTLLSLISAFIQPTSGQIKVLGHAAGSAALQGRIGLLPQDAPMFKGIRIAQQMDLFTKLQGLAASERRAEILWVSEALSVTDLLNRKPENLSHGQTKRVAMAQALLGHPELILLDEPTAGLDPIAANEVRDFIHSQRGKTNFIISSHNLDELETVCQRIILIDQGEILLTSPLSELTGQNTYINVEVSTVVSDSVLIELNAIDAIKQASLNVGNEHHIAIELKQAQAATPQRQILDILTRHDLEVLEIRRGKKLSERVVRLLHADK